MDDRPILFLDLANQMGWAEGIPGDPSLASGSILLGAAGASHARRFAALAAWVDGRIARSPLRMIGFEAPADPRHMGPKTNFQTARFLIGCCAVVEARAGAAGVKLGEARVVTIRKMVLGTVPRAAAKVAVQAAVRRMGFDPVDDNEGDAIAGWIYTAEVVRPGSSIRYLELMGQS